MNAMGMMQDFFKELFDQAKVILLPKTYFAWQTLLLLSLFSVIIAAILDALEPNSTPLSVQVLSTLSWIFLTSAIWWALSKGENPIKVAGFSISPWITGAVLCIFLFQPRTPTRLRWAISCWPMISMGIKALPYFVGWELERKKNIKDKDLQALVVTTLVTLLISSWILFHFRVQDWVTNYPSLLVNGLDRSSFVYDFDGGDRDAKTQGVQLLEGSANAIEEDLNGLPWYQTERWLVNREVQMEKVLESALKTLDAPTEKIFWRLILPVPRRLGEGYLITLRANWLGPVAKDNGFYLEKSCRIMPQESVRQVAVEEDQPLPTSNLTAVTCEEFLPAVKWIKPGGVNG